MGGERKQASASEGKEREEGEGGAEQRKREQRGRGWERELRKVMGTKPSKRDKSKKVRYKAFVLTFHRLQVALTSVCAWLFQTLFWQ